MNIARVSADSAIGARAVAVRGVYHGIRHDLEVDSSEHTPEECAEQIIAGFDL